MPPAVGDTTLARSSREQRYDARVTTRASLLLALGGLAPFAPFACGGSTASPGQDAGVVDAADANVTPSDAPVDHAADTMGSPEAGDSGTGACHIDPAGTMYTFHVHNGGSTDLGLAYGCGGTIPVLLTTPQGMLGIGPGPANGCEFTCQMEYTGPVQTACSDCGPGVGAALDAGATVDIPWDRRVYTAHTADPTCVEGQTDVSCALPLAMAPTSMQPGVLTVCTGGASSGGPGGSGYCSGSMLVPFTVDTTLSQGTIEVP